MKTFQEIVKYRRVINYGSSLYFKPLSANDLGEAKFALKRGSLVPKSRDVEDPTIQHAYDHDNEARQMRARIWFVQGYQMRRKEVLALIREAIVFFMQRNEPAARRSIRQLYWAYNFIA